MKLKKSNCHWEDTWEKWEKSLKDRSDDLHLFRSWHFIQERLWEKNHPNNIANWYNKCGVLGVDKRHFKDNLVGGPKCVQERDGVKVTPNSLRSGWISHKISTLLPEDNQVKTVLEIGGGFGSLADHMFRLFPSIEEYHIIDAKPMQRLQRYYLSEVGVLDMCYLHPPIWYERAANHTHTMSYDHLPQMDVVVTINALPEMPRHVAQKYVDLLPRLMKKDVSLFFTIQRKSAERAPHLFTNWADLEFDIKLKKTFHEDILAKQHWIMCSMIKE